MGVKYIRMKKKVQATGQRTLRSGSRVRSQRKKEQDSTSTSNAALEAGQASLPDIPYLSESLPPFRMNDTILATPPMASPAFSLHYSQAGYDSDESTYANQFLGTLHSRLMGILAQRVTEALKTDALYTRVKETDNQLHYFIRDGLLLAQNTNGYENLYIPVRPLEKGVSLRDFILKTVQKASGISQPTNATPMRLASSGGHRCARTLSYTVGHAISARLTTSPPPYHMDDPLPSLTPTKPTNP